MRLYTTSRQIAVLVTFFFDYRFVSFFLVEIIIPFYLTSLSTNFICICINNRIWIKLHKLSNEKYPVHVNTAWLYDITHHTVIFCDITNVVTCDIFWCKSFLYVSVVNIRNIIIPNTFCNLWKCSWSYSQIQWRC